MKKILGFVICLMFVASNAFAFEAAIRWQPYPAGNTTSEIGDVIQIFDDGADWGTSIDPRINPNSNYIIVQVTGVPADDPAVVQYFERLTGCCNESPIPGEEPQSFVIKKRKYKFDQLKIPQNIINYIENNDGFVVVTEVQWNNYITSKAGQL